MERDIQILSGKIIQICGPEEIQTDNPFCWVLVETNASNAGTESQKVAFNCWVSGENAFKVQMLEEGTYVELEGYMVAEMTDRCEMNFWFDTVKINFETYGKMVTL